MVGSHKRWPDVALIIFLSLLPFLFFWRLTTPNPADGMAITRGDFTEQYFPLRAFTAEEWTQGRIPLWNPYLYGGQPALADIQSGALYPPHILEALLLDWIGLLLGQNIGFPLWALELQVIIHFSLAAVGTYLFARSFFLHSLRSLRSLRSPFLPPVSSPFPSFRRVRFGAVIASLVFTYGGYLTGFPVQQMTILAVSAWLPWVLWAVSVATVTFPSTPHPLTLQRIGDALKCRLSPALFWGALAFAMAILAGHPQTVLYIFYLSLAYTIFFAFSTWRSATQQINDPKKNIPSPPFHISRLLRPLASWLLLIFLGLAIAAAQLLPTLEFISHSLRADLSYQAVSAGLPLNEFITILYPGFFGGSPEYVGVVSLGLIALALTIALTASIRHNVSAYPVRDRTLFWTGAALVSLLLAFGGNTFLYPVFYLLMPGFEAVRQQERAFLIYSFSAAVLAGYGVIALTGPLAKQIRPVYTMFERRLRQIAGAALALTGLFIYGSAASTSRGEAVNLFYGVLWHHLFGLIILGGLLVLFTLRPRRWLRRVWGMALLALWLVFNLFTINWRFNLEKPADPPPFSPSSLIQFLQSNLASPTSLGRIVSGGFLPGGNSAASVYRLQDLTGNTPLQLADVDAFMRQMPSWRLWQLLNVRYVIDTRNLADAGLKLIFEEGELKIFEMGDPFPRAWLVSQVEVIPDDNQAITRLAADDFDLRRTAVLDKPLDVSLVGEASNSTVTVVEFTPTRLKAKINIAKRRLLVFSQIYYPGWQAQIDGQAVELRRVNVIQQGITVPPGSHTVELKFTPSIFKIGIVISTLAGIICLTGLIWTTIGWLRLSNSMRRA